MIDNERILDLGRRYGVERLARAYLGRPLKEFQAAVEELRAQGLQERTGVSGIGLSGGETRRYSLLRAIRAAAEGKLREMAPLEHEAHVAVEARLGPARNEHTVYVPPEVMTRDLTVGTASAGGYLVATQNLGFIDSLRNRSITMAAGATRMPGLVGNVTVPRQTAAATAYWLATESTAITESQQTFGQLTLTPKNVGAYTEISRQLLVQASPGADAVVMQDLAQVVALALDAAAVAGTGASGQPTGILNTAGIGGFTGTSLATAALLNAQSDVLAANGLLNPAAAAYVTTPAVAELLMARQRFTSTDTPLWAGSMVNGQVIGVPGYACSNMPAATMIYGDWSQLVIGEWGRLAVEVNPFANFAAGIVGVRAFYTCDIGVRAAASFTAATSIT